jgi:hypothetical protein
MNCTFSIFLFAVHLLLSSIKKGEILAINDPIEYPVAPPYVPSQPVPQMIQVLCLLYYIIHTHHLNQYFYIFKEETVL